MKANESVFALKDYGKVTITIREKMQELGITRNKLATRAGARNDVITRYYNNEIGRIDLDVLARICFVLDCEIQDVLKFEKP